MTGSRGAASRCLSPAARCGFDLTRNGSYLSLKLGDLVRYAAVFSEDARKTTFLVIERVPNFACSPIGDRYGSIPDDSYWAEWKILDMSTGIPRNELARDLEVITFA